MDPNSVALLVGRVTGLSGELGKQALTIPTSKHGVHNHISGGSSRGPVIQGQNFSRLSSGTSEAGHDPAQ